MYWYDINKQWEQLSNSKVKLCTWLAGKHLNTNAQIKKFNLNLKCKVDGIQEYIFCSNSKLHKHLSKLLNSEAKMPVVFLLISPNGLQYSEEGNDSHCIVVICAKDENNVTNCKYIYI